MPLFIFFITNIGASLGLVNFLPVLHPQNVTKCLTASISASAQWSLWTLTLQKNKKNKHNVGEQGLSSHLSFSRLWIAKYTPFSLWPAMVFCAEDMPIHMEGMNGMLIELGLSSLQSFLLLHSQMGRRDVRILRDNHTFETVHWEHPVARSLVPSGELQLH